jgi:PAS domain S-box-containing protein
LGDCFVLTDPAKADNPIVFATDGFVKVTGYSRHEIIPRNCRFLQCRHTDTAAVKRLKEAIDSRDESVELLLNQKKSGEPFWNLLYTTPLYDATGTVAFFLGGQINCSTTIHSSSDVLKILSQAADTDEGVVEGLMASVPPGKRSITSKLLGSFRQKSTVEPLRQAGREERLLNKIEKLDLKKQIDAFYTAYSKVRHPWPNAMAPLPQKTETVLFGFADLIRPSDTVHHHQLFDLLHLVPLGRHRHSALPDQTGPAQQPLSSRHPDRRHGHLPLSGLALGRVQAEFRLQVARQGRTQVWQRRQPGSHPVHQEVYGL